VAGVRDPRRQVCVPPARVFQSLSASIPPSTRGLDKKQSLRFISSLSSINIVTRQKKKVINVLRLYDKVCVVTCLIVVLRNVPVTSNN
jgi:hypothetical protein